MTKSAIYCIRNMQNGLVYVGSAVDFRIRWRKHRSDLNRGRHHSVALQRAWEKYGPEGFEFQVLEHVEDRGNLIEREQFWIDEFGAYGSGGYNCTPYARAAMLGKKHTQEAIDKISAASRLSNARPELRAIKSARHKGVPRSEEVRRKIAANQPPGGRMTGRKHSPETIEKIRAANTGKKRSPEAIEKIRAANRARAAA